MAQPLRLSHSLRKLPFGLNPGASNGDGDRRVPEDVFLIQHGSVDHASPIRAHFLPIASVDVAEDMELGLDPQNGLNQILATEAGAENIVLVERAEGRSVRDNNISAESDAGPVSAARI